MIKEVYGIYPDETKIGGRSYKVITDFRDWIKLIELTKDKELEPEEKLNLFTQWYVDEHPSDPCEVIEGLVNFILQRTDEQPAKKQIGSKRKKRTIDYKEDADYITAGFMQAYGIDLMDIEYMHWYKFLALFRGLPSDTEIMQRVRYRSIDASSIKDREKRAKIRQIQFEIDLKQEELSDNEIANAFNF